MPGARQRGKAKGPSVWERRSEAENEYALEVGKRISQARKEAGGMTQRELADLLGVTERSVASYELGEVIPYRFVRDLEHYLDKPAGWFLHGDSVAEDRTGYELLLEEIRQLRADLKRKKVL